MAKAKKQAEEQETTAPIESIGMRFMSDLDFDTRLEMLKKKSSRIEYETYERELRAEEIDKHKIDLADNVLQHDVLANELKEIQAEKQVHIKALKEVIDEQKEGINNGTFKGEGDLFFVPNQSQKLFYVYTANGDFVRTEKLTLLPMFDSQGEAYDDTEDFPMENAE